MEPEAVKLGIHLLQIQNPGGQFSNDFIFNVVESKEAAEHLVAMRAREDRDIRAAIAEAIADGDLNELRGYLNRRQQRGRVNERQPSSGAIPLSNAALHDLLEIAQVLRRGANVGGTNRDGTQRCTLLRFFAVKTSSSCCLRKVLLRRAALESEVECLFDSR